MVAAWFCWEAGTSTGCHVLAKGILLAFEFAPARLLLRKLRLNRHGAIYLLPGEYHT